MQLKLQRSQRQSGIVTKGVVFCINARVFFTAEEQGNVQKYKLGNQILYTSEAAKRHADDAARRMVRADAHNEVAREFSSGQALARGMGHMAVGMLHGIAARLSLKITVNSLQNGQQVECKDLDEVLDAEDALFDACNNLKGYLQTAATFDGREVVIDFSKDEPEAVSQPVLIAAPVAPAPILQPAAANDSDTNVFTPNALASAAPAAAAAASTYDYSSPQSNPFQPVLDWWNRLNDTQRKSIVIGAGIVLLIIFVKLL